MTLFYTASPLEPGKRTPPAAPCLSRGHATVMITVIMAALTGAAGCGRTDGRTQVSGSVTWKNTPVQNGLITIEPDSSQGNRGPQSVSAIENGTFRTRATHGSVSGPVVIEVVGYGPLGKGEFPPPLFPTYTFKTEISKGKAVLDIVVPEDVAKPGR
jgi:hypothetical protein